LLLAVAARPAHARSSSGFSAFRVWVQGTVSTNSYLCLGENFGAVVNDCKHEVYLDFDLPMDNAGTKTIAVQDFWGPLSTAFTCQIYSYEGKGQNYMYGGSIDFTAPSQTLTLSVDAPSDWTVQVLCPNVRSGGGIANLHWNP
jgi:hypothetical protein